MADNVQLPGTGQSVAAKSDTRGNEFQEILSVDKTLTPINPSTSDKQDDIVNALTTTEEGIGVADLLLKAMTNEDGLRVQVQLPKDLKQDQSGSLIMSDMIGPYIWSSSTVSQPFILDCTGYDSVFIHKITTGVVTPYVSNDGKTFSATLAIAASTGIPAATLLTAVGMYIIPVAGKYLQLVGPASSIQCFIYLSGNPSSVNANMLSAALQNVTQYGSQPVVSANVNGMPAVGGNIAPGVTPTAYPVLIAGVDQNTTPLTRRLLTDAIGRVQIGNVPSQNTKAINILGFDPTYRNILETQDTTKSDDSQSLQDLNLQILKELQILNHQIYELSKAMQNGQTLNDEPNLLRNDTTIFN
jgi:hypothetical protein